MKYIYDNKLMEYVPYEEKFRLLKYLSLIVLSAVMFLLGTISLGREVEVKRVLITKSSPLPFTEENLKLKLEELCVSYPDIIIQQAKHETNNFKSELFINAHNLFGMKVARIRPRLQRGTYKVGVVTYAQYNNWEESVLDMALWQSSQCYLIKSEEEYYNYLSRNYATDKQYVKKLKKIKV